MFFSPLPYGLPDCHSALGPEVQSYSCVPYLEQKWGSTLASLSKHIYTQLPGYWYFEDPGLSPFPEAHGLMAEVGISVVWGCRKSFWVLVSNADLFNLFWFSNWQSIRGLLICSSWDAARISLGRPHRHLWALVAVMALWLVLGRLSCRCLCFPGLLKGRVECWVS